MDKITLIQNAIDKADKFQSKLSESVKNVPFLGSLKNRALMNNLGELATRYLECGCHKGGSYCSAVFENKNIISATVVDNFLSDETNINDKAKPQFLENARKFTPTETQFKLIHENSFDVNLSEIAQPIDLYLYDAAHEEEEQCKALTYYVPVMADEFIFCVDDYGWDEVRKGTKRGIEEAGLEIIKEWDLKTEKECSNESWWTGMGVFLLKKK